mmetsp:Transcript_72371/g.186670  ORF Transcript_72371/g.186670 Transcript_72371/m.186670 type:complete len:110 (+) Transcript_72371:3-332(+)
MAQKSGQAVYDLGNSSVSRRCPPARDTVPSTGCRPSAQSLSSHKSMDADEPSTADETRASHASARLRSFADADWDVASSRGIVWEAGSESGASNDGDNWLWEDLPDEGF